MPEIEHRFEFEPSPGSLKKWLATRKAPFEIAGVKYPGYFSTTAYSTDKAWVVFAGAIEMAALAIIIVGGITKGGFFLIGSIIAAILMIAFDLVGAEWAHHQVDEVCKLKNQLVLAENTGSQKTLRDQIASKSFTAKRIGGFLFIIFSALLKIGSLFLLASFDLALIFIMLILYILVIYVHVAHTGYFLVERGLRNKDFPRDFAAWSANQHRSVAGGGKRNTSELETHPSEAKPRFIVFYSEISLNMMNDIIRAGEHHIKKGGSIGGSWTDTGMENGEKVHYYTLFAKGILLDSDIQLLTQGNTGRRADVIAKACVLLQTEHFALS